MSRSLMAQLRSLFNLHGSSLRRRKGKGTLATSSSEVLETRQVLSAVSLGVIDGNTFRLDTNQATDTNPAANTTEIDFVFGQPNDLVLTGDWNGQGTTAVLVRQPGQNGAPNDGLIHWYFDADGDADFESHKAFGLGGDNPVVGDRDGDGRDDIGVTRKSGGAGVVNDGLLNWFLSSSSSPTGFIHRKYGFSTDTPVVGNWDGVGRDDLGIVRPNASGGLDWMQDWNGDTLPERIFQFGLRTDQPVTGDWDGNGTDNVGVTRVSGGTSLNWFLDTNSNPTVEINRTLTSTGTKPVVGKWRFAEVQVAGITDGQVQSQHIGIAAVGQTVSRVFTVYNTGTSNLRTGTPIVPAGFEITEPLASVIGPGGVDNFTVTFRPTSEGVVSGLVQFATNDGNELTFDFPIHAMTPAPEIAVYLVTNGQRQAIFDGQNSVIDFGDVLADSSGSVRTFRIVNEGQLPLSLGAVKLPVGYFQVNSVAGQTLAPGAFADLQIQLVTSVIGTKSGQIEILNNDANESPFNFSLRGVVLPRTPEITVSTSGVTITDGQNSAVSFGRIVQNTAGQTVNFNIKNDGTAPLTLSSVTVSNTAFTVVQQPAMSVAPGAMTAFSIRLESNVVGTNDAVVRFTSNDGDEQAFDFPIRGVVETPAAEITVTTSGVNIVDGQWQAVDFGSVELGGNSSTRSFTIRNDGNIPLLLGAITVPQGYSIASAPASTVAPGATTTLSIRMSADALGRLDGSVSIMTNDSDENPFNFQVTGMVTNPEVQVQIGSTVVPEGQAGKLFMGASFNTGEFKTFRVSNSGTAPLVLSAPTVMGSYSVIGPWNQAIAPGSSAEIRVVFTATTPGLKLGTLRFATNDRTGGEAMIQIDLRGKVFAGANRNPVFNEVVTASTYSLFGDYSSIEVEPANGNVPFPTSYVIVATLRSGAVSRIYCNGSLRAVRVIGSTSFTYDDWTEQIALI